MKSVLMILISGVFGCVAMDMWQILLKRVIGFPSSNWAIVGRWFLILISNGKVYNPAVMSLPEMKFEIWAGWILHYFVAIGYAVTFWVLVTYFEIVSPNFFSGLLFGLGSVVVPWFFFMPCLGNGVMANKTTNPFSVCVAALASHTIFGVAIALTFSLSLKLL